MSPKRKSLNRKYNGNKPYGFAVFCDIVLCSFLFSTQSIIYSNYLQLVDLRTILCLSCLYRYVKFLRTADITMAGSSMDVLKKYVLARDDELKAAQATTRQLTSKSSVLSN